MGRSEQLFARASAVMPGGVNSPVRAFQAVGGNPRFIKSGTGSHIIDEDGVCYIDFVGSWGPLILGHANETVLRAVSEAMQYGLSFGAPTALEVEMAELLVSMVPHIEMVRMVNSGTEAVMSALRVARGVTGRAKIIKFEGCYHGHSDAMLVRAGSGALTAGTPDSAGVAAHTAADTLTARYNDLASVEALLQANTDQVAAVIVEPVAANMGVVPPHADFLPGLRALCDRFGALLIFDEVITGFRLALGGAQEYFGVRADLVTYGKIIGGGMPVGAYAGSRALMEQVAPAGPIYQAGTLSGNPVAMAAGLAQLQMLQENPTVYTQIDTSAAQIAGAMRTSAAAHGVALQVNRCGGLLCPYFTDHTVDCYEAAKSSNTVQYAAYFNKMLAQGIYLAPSQYEAMFVNACHSAADIAAVIAAADAALASLTV